MKLTVRHCKRNRRPSTPPRVVKMRGFKFKGFKVNLLNNRIYGPFNYEYQLVALTPSTLRLTRLNGKLHPIIYDASSMMRPKATRFYAKMHIGCLRAPVHLRND